MAAQGVLWAASVGSAGLFGAAAGLAIARARAEQERRRALHQPFEDGAGGWDGGPSQRALGYAAQLSRELELGSQRALLGHAGRLQARRWLDAHAKKAGVEGVVTPAGLVEAMVRLGAAGAVCGAAVGCVLSAQLALALGVAAAAAGATAPPRALKRRVRQRADGLERGLSEMLEVVALGLRSGLSFDRSFQLYGQHFDSDFARSCAACRRRWASGLATREDALRDLAASYDSALFERVVQGMVRSLRFGTSLAEGLEQAAGESRAAHRARVEERVAKAPVKMMLPTAALILPAMLLLVLGPVLLELMGGI